MITLPSLFLSHGAPTFALEPGRAGPLLTAMGERIPRPRAILVASAHWMTRGVEVSSAKQPETIHDFGGFPSALYRILYSAPGAPDVAAEVIELLRSHGVTATAKPDQGLDHGAWVPLLHLFPKADIPTLQISMPALGTPKSFVEFGARLSKLRREGVLVVGSGSITHNLGEFRGGSGSDAPYVTEFCAWIADRIADGDLASLLDYRRLAPHAVRAHPTDEHLMPLFVALGAAGVGLKDALRVDGGIANGVLGMDSYVFGASALKPIHHASAQRQPEKEFA